LERSFVSSVMLRGFLEDLMRFTRGSFRNKKGESEISDSPKKAHEKRQKNPLHFRDSFALIV
jgi:hypothetical protein